MVLTDAQQIAADLAEIYAHDEKPHGEWLALGDAASLIAGYEVLPHVQRFADDIRKATRVQSIGTYPGHSPSIDRALDLFHALSDKALASAISDFAIANQKRYGVRYVIDRQRIWHRLDPFWRDMEDRGDNTQNHFDHDHVSFETEAEEPDPDPTPEPHEEDDGMKFIAVDNDRGIFLAGENVEDDGKVNARHVGSPEEITAMVESGAISHYDKRPVMPAAVFDAYYRVVG